MSLKGKVLIAQGGGPTAVINQSLVGAILESRKYSQVTQIYGALHGVKGIVNEDFIDLTNEEDYILEKVADSPSSALCSTRDKPDEKYCKEIFNVLKAHEIKYFYYIGGNDSADTVNIVNNYALNSKYDLKSIHIPKTIDNDLVINDHCPGFGSAAKFVAQAYMGINLDNRALPGVYIGIIMGRNSGFLTAASAVAKKNIDDGPHLVYVPERAFDVDEFLKDVKKTYNRFGRCVIAVSEGIKDIEGNPIVTKLQDIVEKDAHGNVQLSGNGKLGDLLAELVKEKLKISRVRTDTFGYLQRSFFNCVSDTDQKEAREAGRKAAEFAIRNNSSGTVIIHRNENYCIDYRLNNVENVARKTKILPNKFINIAGNGVTNEFIKYVTPLLGTGIATPHVLCLPKVEKIYRIEDSKQPIVCFR
jgi:6-phosphofructokinase 1